MPDYSSPTVKLHRQQSPESVACAVITVSDTRTLETDRGGAMLVELLTGAGHEVIARQILPDDPQLLAAAVRQFSVDENIDAILLTGGTGISPRDQTPEALAGVFTKELPGYGELLRVLSYEEIGPAAMLSRATGGLVDQTVVLTMPGSTAAVRLATEKLILPELAHLVREATK
ncbi:MogA/MoaB family molybdenum cofactor biosynthesis protein [Adhaeretor mobilis]|uniref:Molybdenum cofactor biosynthesis protein B n=1 Tax=Adhaeretor mobilis TaxID=1930276 RepID=A0A517N2C2_9BACT|nr:MogA/MoaB family molybdenum cofactor biosynthesis protein [Adhaeretor mobilis]QDT01287.1 Molybdenum cofactor biosynthesis protein B [Adhaeretor mobilis]